MRELSLIVGFMALIFIAGLIAMTLEDNNSLEQMKVCVEAGKTWEHKYGNIYECVDRT